MKSNQVYLSDVDYSCVLFSLKPKWLQKFATKEMFLSIFCLASVLQGMYFTYFVSVLTTIEKLYQIRSKTTGMIMSTTEIGQITGSLLLTYYGGQGNRPKWITCGMLIFAFAAILSSTPHYIFGSSIMNLNNYNISWEDNQCTLLACSSQDINGPIEKNKMAIVLSIFFISLLFIGIGSNAVNNLGIPYIDDNIAPKESPIYFSITSGIKIMGPVLGFVLGSICTSIYLDFPFEDGSSLSPSDPQWIGAWWLGVLFVGISLIIASIFMSAFPKRLPQPDPNSFCHLQQCSEKLISNGYGLENNSQNNQLTLLDEKINCSTYQLHDVDTKNKEIIIKSLNINEDNGNIDHEKIIKSNAREKNGFMKTLSRLLSNDILRYRIASSVLHMLPISGIYTFLPKYLESQFMLTASKSNMIAGIAGIMVMGIGILGSGIIMRKFKPKPRTVALLIVIASLSYCGGMIILMWLGCPGNTIIGLNFKSDISSFGECSCSCPKRFSPVCLTLPTNKTINKHDEINRDKVTYLSSCWAGCSQVIENGTNHLYEECSCLGVNVKGVNGFCETDCNNLIWYILVFSLIVLIHSTSDVGAMLLILRCVEPNDKAMALGLTSVAIGFFANIPCPIIYGAIVDSTCIFWEDNCGKPGACRIYDPDKFRIYFHGITSLIMFAAFLVDLIVWFKANSIDFNDKQPETNIKKEYRQINHKEACTKA